MQEQTTRERCALLVDPDEQACRSVRPLLQALGYEVVTMSDGESAISVFGYVDPDIVLAAYAMPDHGATRLTTYIRRAGRLHTTPVLALIHSSDRALGRIALADGCAGVVTKPVDPEVLALQLRRFARSPEPPPNP